MYSRNLIVKPYAYTLFHLCGMCGKSCETKSKYIQDRELYLCEFCHKKLDEFPWYNILLLDELNK